MSSRSNIVESKELDNSAGNSSIAILSDAKEEYTKQLINIVRDPMYFGIKSIYTDAKTICANENRPQDVLMVFQDLLARIPKWSQEIIIKEYERITSVSKCDWIEDLLKVIYVAHIKVLTIINNAVPKKKISIKIPAASHFLHLCYIELARQFWKNPYLYSDIVSKYEYQKNMRESESIIEHCIVDTIRKQLPVRHILKEYFAADATADTAAADTASADNDNTPTTTDDDATTEDIKQPINTKYLKKLEKMIKKELNTPEVASAVVGGHGGATSPPATALPRLVSDTADAAVSDDTCTQSSGAMEETSQSHSDVVPVQLPIANVSASNSDTTTTPEMTATLRQIIREELKALHASNRDFAMPTNHKDIAESEKQQHHSTANLDTTISSKVTPKTQYDAMPSEQQLPTPEDEKPLTKQVKVMNLSKQMPQVMSAQHISDLLEDDTELEEVNFELKEIDNEYKFFDS